jgi:hypothetical protein
MLPVLGVKVLRFRFHRARRNTLHLTLKTTPLGALRKELLPA